MQPLHHNVSHTNSNTTTINGSSTSSSSSSSSSSNDSGNTLDNTFRQCQRLILELQQQLEQLETGRDVSVELQGRVSANINQLARLEKHLRQSLRSVTLAPHMKEQYKRQMDRISEEHMVLRRSVNRYLKKMDESARQRDLLLELGNPFENGNPNSSSNGSAMTNGGGTRKRLGFLSGSAALPTLVDGDPFAARMQERGTQKQSLIQSLQLVEQMKQVGANVGAMLSEQGEVLLRARQQLWEVGSLLGLSQSTLRMIERRLTVDRWLVYIGMIAVTLLLLFIWLYMLRG